MHLGSQLLQYSFAGLTLGSIYALVALAFVTTFNITGVLNLAMGEFLTFGALLAVSLVAAGLPLPLACGVAVCLVALLGGLMERVAVRPVLGAPPLVPVMVTIGLAVSLRGVALLAWGTQTYTLPAFSPGESLQVGGAVLTLQSVWVLGFLALVLVGLFVFFDYTLTGKAVRACMINRAAAELLGIRPERMAFYSFVASGALGAAAGILITPITLATYDVGFMLGLKGFIGAVVGGLTSVPGAVVGGLLLGLLEAFGAGLVASGMKDVVAMLVLLAVLLVRPTGIFGLGRGREA
ncbi:MAG: branched-chain amino acid ABC transporter permease [Desulfotomaculales bacterium]